MWPTMAVWTAAISSLAPAPNAVNPRICRCRRPDDKNGVIPDRRHLRGSSSATSGTARVMRGASAVGCALGPECRRASGIGGMSPDLGRLAICGVDDVDQVELKLLAGPFGADRGERDRMVIADQDVMQLRLNRATGQLRDLAKNPHYLRRAVIVTRQRARARHMPDDVLGEVLILQGAQVAAAESRASRSHQVFVRLRHRTPSTSARRTNRHRPSEGRQGARQVMAYETVRLTDAYLARPAPALRPGRTRRRGRRGCHRRPGVGFLMGEVAVQGGLQRLEVSA